MLADAVAIIGTMDLVFGCVPFPLPLSPCSSRSSGPCILSPNRTIVLPLSFLRLFWCDSELTNERFGFTERSTDN
jgi:hypothetical protein